jgi:nucleotide-binding universal stress UspA family protein
VNEKVVIAVDGGAASEAALEWVIDRSAHVALEFEIITVDEWGDDLPSDEESDDRLAHDVVLRSARRRAAEAAPGVTVTTAVRVGPPAQALIEASRHADLLVIGTNKTSTLAGMVHGTLPLKVAGRARCTTVVVPFSWKPRSGPVVVGWVDDPTADRALDLAAAEADRSGSVLRVIHAWKVPVSTGIPGSEALRVDDIIEVNRALLSDAATRIRNTYPGLTVTEHLESGSATVALVHEASTASLVVVGTRGHGAVTDLLLGSVSHDLILNMPAPVAVVPPYKEPIDVYPELLDEDLI